MAVMNKDNLITALTQSGLPSKAAAMYIALLGTKKMTISEIARETRLKRATCYEYLDILLSRELLVRLPIGKRMHYAAANPQKILSQLKKSTERLEQVLPEMLEMHEKALKKPKVTFYDGKKEVRSIYEDMFTTVGEVRSIFPPAAFFENFTESDYADFDKSLSKHAIVSKDLFVQDKSYKKVAAIRESNAGNKSGKKLPKWFSSNVDVLIYSEKVALISLRDLSGVVIENKDIADLFRNFHAALWK